MIIANILSAFKETFTLSDAYSVNESVNKESVRARIYENLGKTLERVSRGVYAIIDGEAILVEGDGRDLSFLKDKSLDALITDFPWLDKKSNYGGNRGFTSSYQENCFEYTLEDFQEKARVLKQGSFLVECLPAENENNFEMLYKIKKLAQAAGFKYYAKVPWIKSGFVANTGRKAKNSEDIMIFSLGEPRCLRVDAKKTKATGTLQYMKGTCGMLPTAFEVPPVPRNEVIAQSEKPVELFMQILEYISLEGELVADTFAGSGAVGVAAVKTKRKCILIEKSKECCKKIRNRFASLKAENLITKPVMFKEYEMPAFKVSEDGQLALF